ncbi:MAG: three-Cys-motif partner protein TcmP [Candidatus Binatia bacterium]
MALEFKEDAICLSGLTGSKLKCEVIGRYYPFWWSITSGGAKARYEYPTAIVELDAATGEVHIEDTGETILGSSGHALELKCHNPHTNNLKIVLVEKEPACYGHLKNVIGRRWSTVSTSAAEGPVGSNTSGIYLLNKPLDAALHEMNRMRLGNALFFFDPLRSTEYRAIEEVARARISSFYKTGTEFIIFVFTSDWFLGRDDFKGLPVTANESSWSIEERNTVVEADEFLGTTGWRGQILNNNPIHLREERLVEYYRHRLHRWFRYVLPMPFNPKGNQIFHLILCSNYATGVRATREFYCDITGNPKYAPQNNAAYREFRTLHPDVFVGLSGAKRPLEWRMLWKIVAEHEEGIGDSECSDFRDIEPNPQGRQRILEWLEKNSYIEKSSGQNAWGLSVPQYRLRWSVLKQRLRIDTPPPFKPLSLKPLSMEDINR